MRNVLKSCAAATVLSAAAFSFAPEAAVAGTVGLSSQEGVSLASPTDKVQYLCYRRCRPAHYGYYGYGARPGCGYYGYARPSYYGYAAAPAPCGYYGAAYPAYGNYGAAYPAYGNYGAAYPGYGYYGWGGVAAAAWPLGWLGGWWW